jgi:hypothetical protein
MISAKVENKMWEAHDAELDRRFPSRNQQINIGWSVDMVEGTITSKVYGRGYLTTDKDLNHTWEPV